MREAFARRGKVMFEMLSAIPGVACLEPQGAFYCFPSFEGVLGREIGGRRPQTTLELCEVLLDVAQVAIVPGEAFGAPGYARLSFALGDDDLGEGIRRIADCRRALVREAHVARSRPSSLDWVMAPRVLVAEPLAERGLEAMRQAGLEVEVKTGLTPEELGAALPASPHW